MLAGRWASPATAHREGRDGDARRPGSPTRRSRRRSSPAIPPSTNREWRKASGDRSAICPRSRSASRSSSSGSLELETEKNARRIAVDQRPIADSARWPRRSLDVLCLCASAAVVAQRRSRCRRAASDTPDFLTRYDFHLSAAALERRSAIFVGHAFRRRARHRRLRRRRASVLIDYEAVLGNQLSGLRSESGQLHPRDVGVGSRGRQDRSRRLLPPRVAAPQRSARRTVAIAWNVLGRAGAAPGVVGRLDDRSAASSAGYVTERAYVDYRWIGHADVAFAVPAEHPRRASSRTASGQLFGLDPTVCRRASARQGGRVEGGVRSERRGPARSSSLSGLERRIDADPLD